MLVKMPIDMRMNFWLIHRKAIFFEKFNGFFMISSKQIFNHAMQTVCQIHAISSFDTYVNAHINTLKHSTNIHSHRSMCTHKKSQLKSFIESWIESTIGSTSFIMYSIQINEMVFFVCQHSWIHRTYAHTLSTQHLYARRRKYWIVANDMSTLKACHSIIYRWNVAIISYRI